MDQTILTAILLIVIVGLIIALAIVIAMSAASLKDASDELIRARMLLNPDITMYTLEINEETIKSLKFMDKVYDKRFGIGEIMLIETVVPIKSGDCDIDLNVKFKGKETDFTMRYNNTMLHQLKGVKKYI